MTKPASSDHRLVVGEALDEALRRELVLAHRPVADLPGRRRRAEAVDEQLAPVVAAAEARRQVRDVLVRPEAAVRPGDGVGHRVRRDRVEDEAVEAVEALCRRRVRHRDVEPARRLRRVVRVLDRVVERASGRTAATARTGRARAPPRGPATLSEMSGSGTPPAGSPGTPDTYTRYISAPDCGASNVKPVVYPPRAVRRRLEVGHRVDRPQRLVVDVEREVARVRVAAADHDLRARARPCSG